MEPCGAKGVGRRAVWLQAGGGAVGTRWLPGGLVCISSRSFWLHMSRDLQHFITTDSFLVLVVEQPKGCSMGISALSSIQLRAVKPPYIMFSCYVKQNQGTLGGGGLSVVVNGHSRIGISTQNCWSSRKARRLTSGRSADCAAVSLVGIAQIVTTAKGPRLSAPHRVLRWEGYMCVQTA